MRIPGLLALVLLCLCPAAIAAAQGKAADFGRGLAAYESGDFPTALQEWQPLADAGDVAAMRNLGHLYRWGRGVDQDPARAALWYERAALRGSERAQANLAAMYLAGEGVARDQRRAAGWFARAARQGHTIAQYNLGLMYEHGLGVEKDNKRALGLFLLAARSGHPPARARVTNLMQTLKQDPQAAGQAEELVTAALAALSEEAVAASQPAADKVPGRKAAASDPAPPAGKAQAGKAQAGTPAEKAPAVIAQASNKPSGKKPISAVPATKPPVDQAAAAAAANRAAEAVDQAQIAALPPEFTRPKFVEANPAPAAVPPTATGEPLPAAPPVAAAPPPAAAEAAAETGADEGAPTLFAALERAFGSEPEGLRPGSREAAEAALMAADLTDIEAAPKSSEEAQAEEAAAEPRQADFWDMVNDFIDYLFSL